MVFTTAAFIQSLTVILREGLEAILIIGAIVAYLHATKNKEKTKAVWYGVSLAIVASFITAFLIETVFKLGEAHVEILEGITLLLAAAVLFYVGHWLLSKMHSERWDAYIKKKVSHATAKGSTFMLAAVAFLAVYREGFETVLFYKALLINSPETSSILIGFIVGIVILAAIIAAFYKYGVKIPMKYLFLGTSTILYIMSFVFAGHGVHELQEANVLSETALNIPQIPLLRIYPTVETTVVQVVLILAILATIHVVFKKKK